MFLLFLFVKSFLLIFATQLGNKMLKSFSKIVAKL